MALYACDNCIKSTQHDFFACFYDVNGLGGLHRMNRPTRLLLLWPTVTLAESPANSDIWVPATEKQHVLTFTSPLKTNDPTQQWDLHRRTTPPSAGHKECIQPWRFFNTPSAGQKKEHNKHHLEQWATLEAALKIPKKYQNPNLNLKQNSVNMFF